MESAKLRKGGTTVREFVVWAEVNLAVVLAIRDHHGGHPDYLADGINGDRLMLQVYDGLDSARFGNAKQNVPWHYV